MKFNSLYIIHLTIILLTFSASILANNNSRGNLIIRQKRFIEKNDSLFLSIDIIFSGRLIPSALGMKLVPVLKSGNKSIDLPYVLINGKQRAAYYEREKNLLPYGSKKLEGLYASIIQSGDNNTPQFIRYNINIPYQPWMNQASLLLRQLQVDCCSETLLSYDMIASDAKMRQTRQKNASNAVNFASNTSKNASTLTQKHVKVDYSKRVNYIKPKAEPIKTRIKSTSAYVNYPQGQSDILPHFATNAAELHKVQQIIQPILSNPLYTLNQIMITGYASPEGSYSNNEQLAQNRSIAFKKYIQKEYGLNDEKLFSTSSIAEDWDKLIDLIQTYPIPEKNKVLNIIHRTRVPDERENKLKKLSGGNVYPMLRNLYPKLRRIDIIVYYSVGSVRKDDALDLLYSSPSSLSLAEMFEVSTQFKPGSKDYGYSFFTAAALHPNEPVANINAAAAALVLNDTQKARFYLAKVRKDPRAYNNMGIYFLQQGNIKKAKECFNKAKTKEAKENLKLL